VDGVRRNKGVLAAPQVGLLRLLPEPSAERKVKAEADVRGKISAKSRLRLTIEPVKRVLEKFITIDKYKNLDRG
jgi:hypothetical protein